MPGLKDQRSADRRLLCADRERPRRRPSHDGNELAPFHCVSDAFTIMPEVGLDAGYQNRKGALAEWGARRHVRCKNREELRSEIAISKLMHRSKQPRHSITLSARATNVAGTVTPIPLAVLRLITSSNLVACSTGMSATLLPRKILTICWAIISESS